MNKLAWAAVMTVWGSMAILSAASYRAPGEPQQLKVQQVGVFPQKDGRKIVLECLGRPLPSKQSAVDFVTVGPDGDRIAWGVTRATIEHFLVGYSERSGFHKLDLTKYFGPHSYRPSLAAAGDSIYVLAGNRGAALIKYHIPTKTSKVLHFYKERLYYLGVTRDSRGRIFWATYPKTEVIGVDPATDKIISLGRMTEDPRLSYALNASVDDDDVMYVPVGEHHCEMFAVDLKSGRKKQILTPQETKDFAANHTQLPRVSRINGKVYTQIGKKIMLCTPDGLVTPDTAVSSGDFRSGIKNNARHQRNRFSDDTSALYFDADGLWVKERSGKVRCIPIEGMPVVGHELFAIGATRDGVLYGSGIFPANVFALDLKTLVSTDWGMGSRGGVQNYDLVSTPKGILMASYVECYFDMLDPSQPWQAGKNPRPFGDLRKWSQDRPIRFTQADEEGNVFYIGTIPTKNKHGGVIARIDVRTGAIDAWRDVIPRQSIMDLVVVPGTRLLFGTSSIMGGTGSQPVEKSAKVFLFDMDTNKVVWQASPRPEAQHYQASAVTGNGKIMFLSRGKDMDTEWHLFDPATRRVIRSANLGKGDGRFVFSEKRPVGTGKRNYFVSSGKLYEYDYRQPAPVALFAHPSLRYTGYVTVADDGYFYYLDECRLMRVKVCEPGPVRRAAE